MATPKVSVILPTRDRAHTLRRAIDSVLKQTFTDFELIVIDDGSTDGTAELVTGYRDARVRYSYNGGPHSVCYARNAGLRLVRAPLIAFQDSDDEWLPRKLKVQIEKLDSLPTEVALVYGPRLYVRLDGTVQNIDTAIFTKEEGHTFRRALNLEVRGIAPQSVLVRREAVDGTGGFDEKMTALEDLELFIRIARHYRFQYIPDYLVRYYETAGSLSRNPEYLYNNYMWILKKYEAEIGPDSDTLAAYYRILGRCLVLTSRGAESRAWMWKAVRKGKTGPRDIFWLLASFLPGYLLHKILRRGSSFLRKLGNSE